MNNAIVYIVSTPADVSIYGNNDVSIYGNFKLVLFLGTRFGFQLSSLVLQSCDDQWVVQPEGISPQDISKPVFKMATLNDFGVYITPQNSPRMHHVLEPLTGKLPPVTSTVY